MIDVCKDRVTRKDYNKLSAYNQGYVSYMQAKWPRSEVPEECPYKQDGKESKAWDDWHMGQSRACIDVIDMDD